MEQPTNALLDDSKTPVRIMSLNEARQLAQFSTVIVLVPLHLDNDGNSLLHFGEKRSVEGWDATFKVPDFSNNSTTQCIRRAAGHFVFGDVNVDFATMEVNRGGEPVKLTALEFKALKYLIQNPRRVISRTEFLNEVWGYNNYPTTRTVDNQLSKLRKKLEREPSQPVHLQTVHGTGYKFLP
jgi:hypothetical protein